jgi:small conductance mechanosensitive channel
MISGFFIIFDGILKPGDLAKVGDAHGVVEAVGLRDTQIRGSEGQLWFIPNGQVAVVANFNRGWTRAAVQVLISCDQDVHKALEALQQAGNDFVKMHADIVLEPPEAQGILAAGSDVGLRLVIKVNAADHSEIERKLRQVIKERFDAEGVKLKLA